MSEKFKTKAIKTTLDPVWKEQFTFALKPEDCGGPIVDLSGAVVGVNVARAGRIETLALPAEDVQAVVARLLAADQKPREAGTKR